MSEPLRANDSVTIALKELYQGKVLESALHTLRVQLSPEMAKHAKDFDYTDAVKSQMMSQLGQELVNKFKDKIVSVYHPGNHHEILELQILAMPLADLKHAVEFCIRQIPEEQLSKIRNQK